jgi:hypothetical protein
VFDFTAPPPVTKQSSKPFNGVFTGGVTAKQPFVPKADPLPVYVNPVKSVFSTAVSKKQVGGALTQHDAFPSSHFDRILLPNLF